MKRHAFLAAGGDDEIIGLLLLQHQPLHLHVIEHGPSRAVSRDCPYRDSRRPGPRQRGDLRVTNVSPPRTLV